MFWKPLSLLFLSAFLLTGCGSIQAPPYTPNYAHIDKFDSKGLDEVSLGNFQPTDKSHPVNKVSLRASSLSTSQGHFAGYLKQAIKEDLREIGIYNPNATKAIEANILKNDIDISGVNVGTGEISADLKILKGDTVIFEKNYYAHIEFESAFAAAIAVPRGSMQYAQLVKTLLGKVYQDPEFIEAISK